jgi:hypothetical protein
MSYPLTNNPNRNRSRRRLPGAAVVGRLMAVAAAAAALTLASCQAATTAPRNLNFVTLNDSGVTGSVEFRDVGGRTEVDVRVEPAGNLDMPAHIHPGTCDNLTPQPKYPLENVRNGVSSTVVPAGIAELFAGQLALNIHRSNDDLRTYTACVDIR